MILEACVRGPVPAEWEADMRIDMRLRIKSVMKWVVDPKSLPDDFELTRCEVTRRAVFSFLLDYP